MPSTGSFDLPVLGDLPPPHYSVVTPEGNLPALKWLDSHRPVFKVHLAVESSLHPLDRYIVRFLRECYEVEASGDQADITGLVSAMKMLSNANAQQLILFLHLVLNNLFSLIVRPCITADDAEIPSKAFQTIAAVTLSIHELRLSSDKHGRNIILASFIQHMLTAPVGNFGASSKEKRSTMLADAKMVFEDEEGSGRHRASSVKMSAASTMPSKNPLRPLENFPSLREGNGGQKVCFLCLSLSLTAHHCPPHSQPPSPLIPHSPPPSPSLLSPHHHPPHSSLPTTIPPHSSFPTTPLTPYHYPPHSSIPTTIPPYSPPPSPLTPHHHPHSLPTTIVTPFLVR